MIALRALTPAPPCRDSARSFTHRRGLRVHCSCKRFGILVPLRVTSDYSLIDGTCQIEQADINDDESIDIFDVIEVINIIFGN